MIKLRTWLVVGLILIIAGCDLAQKAPTRQSGRVALIDIVRISNETGHTDKINNEITQTQSILQQELGKLQGELQGRISETQKKFGAEPPTDEQRKELTDMIGAAQQEFQLAQGEATKQLKQKQVDLVNAFREVVRPVAKQVANDRGMTVVLIHNEAFVMDHDPSTDITDAVIAGMPKVATEMPKVSAEEMEPATEAESPATETPATEAMETPAQEGAAE